MAIPRKSIRLDQMAGACSIQNVKFGEVKLLKKKASLILCLFMSLVMVISACSKDSKDSNSTPAAGGTNSPKASEAAAKAPVPLKVFMVGNPELDFANNSFTQEMNKLLNVKLDLQVNNGAVVKEKRQLSLVSGDYADVFVLDWNDNITTTEQVKLGQQGVLLPLNKLIDEYAPHIKKLLQETPGYKEGVTAPDGNIYALPAINECYHCSYGNKIWVNSEWLKAVKLDVPKTTDDFTKMLRAFKENDLNGNGKKDEVPLSSSAGQFFTNLMNPFIYNDLFINGGFLRMLDGGKIDFTANKPEFKAGLQYMTSLYKEGLLDPGALTYKFDEFRSLTNRDGIAMVGVVTAMHPYVFVAPENKTSTQYVAIPPLTGPNGVSTTYYAGLEVSGDTATFAITNKANKDQQIAAIKLADYMASEEGTLRMTFGPEGTNWVRGQSTDLDLNGKQAKYKVIPKTADEVKQLNNAWGEIGTFVKTKDFRASIAADQNEMTANGLELRLFNATKLYESHKPKEIVPTGLFFDQADLTDFGLLKTNLSKYVEENAYKFITGDKNFEKDWDTYTEGFKKLDVDRYVSIVQKAYDKRKK